MDATINAYAMYLNTWESLDKAIETAQQLEAVKAPAKAIRGAWDTVAKLQDLKAFWKIKSDDEFAAEEVADALAEADAILAGKAA